MHPPPDVEIHYMLLQISQMVTTCCNHGSTMQSYKYPKMSDELISYYNSL